MKKSQFSAFIERLSDVTGIKSQTALADALSIHRSAITQARKKDAIPEKWMVVLFKKYGVNPEWLESGVGPAFLKGLPDEEDPYVNIPKVAARLSAGGGSFENDDRVEGYYSFSREWVSRKGPADKMVLMDVTGHSMEPELRDGDTVMVNQASRDILAGAIYAVGIDDTILVKRLEKLPNTLVLQSDNKNYSPILLKGEELNSVSIIGRVIWVCREYR